MLDWLLAMDTALFRLLNSTLTNPVFDVVMPFVTNARNWIAPLAILALFMLWRGKERERLVALLVILSVTTTDIFCYQVVKQAFHRLRPSHALEDARVLGKKGGKYGFPSNHAANITAAMTMFAYYYRRRRYQAACACIAGVIGYSRVYVGVHYPLDVLAGMVIGASISLGWIFAWQQAERRQWPQQAGTWIEMQALKFAATPTGKRLLQWMLAVGKQIERYYHQFKNGD
ncbi:putative Membrane-associated phospholipid phosphatase [Candidatus Moduliflexus flocculans]|uniref:Putative Membrane-associated phospholipid phosphatase n=1 Tax=Candidatus Moduliflexus flocculans TaxID=1499966 RepID=A0A081BN32_9BACT|nr:putative Membrane-associated phospholipid phosphatase [Candidatus Moduliflexus flocculans]